jgi:hypothetical protein
MDTLSFFDPLTEQLKAQVAARVSTRSILSVVGSNNKRGYSIAGRDGKMQFTRYAVYLFVLSGSTEVLVIFTDYGVNRHAPTSKITRTYPAEATAVLDPIVAFLIDGQLPGQ